MLRHLLLPLALSAALTNAQTICQIQGAGAASSYDGQQVTTQGIVTAVFTGSGTLNGYFIEDPGCDADVNTSNGIFVYDSSPGAITVGQRVSVTGTVAEFNGLTEITFADHTLLGSGTVSPTDITLPTASGMDWERYEGMFLRFPGTLTVTNNSAWGRYGELSLAPDRLRVPTEHIDPNDAVASGNTTTGGGNNAVVAAAFDLNERSSILLDDARTTSWPTPLPWADANGTLRTGSTIQDLQGVLHYSYSAYRLEPTRTLQFNHSARPAVPEVGGSLRAASLNVLNYFTTLGEWGAANPEELDRQRTKLVAALASLNADVVALCEVENQDAAWQDLLAGLNSAMGVGTYLCLEEDGFGGGTRTVILYKPTKLSPVGQLHALNTNIFQRPHLSQGFEVNTTGTRFLFSTMHLRSKLCDNAQGENLDQGDGQGCFNAQRRAQVNALAQHWADLRTSSGIEAQLIMGDHNAYAQEDPIDALRAAGLRDVLDGDEHTYAYQGYFGKLDHAFTTAAMEERITGAAVWHINSDEPGVLNYSDQNIARYQPNAFRCSDHDPLLVGFDAAPVSVFAPVDTAAYRLSLNGTQALWTLPQEEGAVWLELTDARGALLRTTQHSTSATIREDLGGLASGLLVWRIMHKANGGTVAQGRAVLP